MRKAKLQLLTQLPLDKKKAILAKLGTIISAQQGLALFDADDAAMQRLAAAWPVFSPSFAYDAVSILGFGAPSIEPLPKPKNGEIVIHYGGWSLTELRDCPVVRERNLMWEQDWYNRYQWSTEKLPAGIYHLRVPVLNSNRQTFAEQVRSLPSGEEPAPATLVATALLVHYLQTGEDLLRKNWTRCKEQTTGGFRAVLDWVDGRLFVDDCWDGYRRFDYLFLSSLRTS